MKEVLKLALEALENAIAVRHGAGGTKLFDPLEKNAIIAIKEALALTSTQCEKQPAQEPVGVVRHKPTDVIGADYEQITMFTRALEPGTKLYTTPPAAQPPLPVQEPDELTIAYMSGLYDGKKKRPWAGLTDDELADLWYKESLDWMEFARAHEDALRSKNA
jgi:hypothetical protein